MEAEDNRVKTNKYGQAVLSSNDLMALVLQGKNINHLIVVEDDEIELFQKYQSELLSETITFLDQPNSDLTFEQFHEKCANEWTFPAVYQQIDVERWLLARCKSQEEIDRVLLEYKLYEERNLVMLLRFFIYLVDFMREHKFLWGVGRGSSVSSYILYIIGVHRVNSLQYQLDIKDYLK